MRDTLRLLAIITVHLASAKIDAEVLILSDVLEDWRGGYDPRALPFEPSREELERLSYE